MDRVVPLWNEHIVPELAAGHSVVIAAHGHTIRALVKNLDGLSDEAIAQLSIPNGVPLVYKLDEQLQPICRRRESADPPQAADSVSLCGCFLGEVDIAAQNSLPSSLMR